MLANPTARDCVLNNCSLTDAELSHHLHSALTESGFVDARAALQSAVAQVLEKILGERPYQDSKSTFVVGSYSEGWGNSLVTLDGRTDIDSDIDVMELIPGRLYHVRNQCRCRRKSTEQVEYKNGHILCSKVASPPEFNFKGSSLRPAVDNVLACRLCSYPPIAPLLPSRISKSNIPQSVLRSLQHELTSSPCHVVHAAAPRDAGRLAGKQLRVSTTFLEKRLLQSLSTLQGQLFVTLKYLVKKVISQRVPGMKSYHAKAIMFRMLEETPADEWKSENLVSLTRKSLQMLLNSVKSSAKNADGKIMDHFFLCHAALYLKGEQQVLHSSRAITKAKQLVMNVIESVINELPKLLMEFKDSLRPLTTSGTFYFHPFLALPRPELNSVPRNSNLKYHEIYDVVRESLVQLSVGRCSIKSKKSLTEMIDRLPDCARSARGALRALTCLKFGNRDTAVTVLSDCSGRKVSRGIAWPAEGSKAEASENFVWQHLRGCDSAWKFCFYFDQRLEFKFLPTFVSKHFPLQLRNCDTYFYMNFDALLQCLRIVLKTGDVSLEEWIIELTQREDADEQELRVAKEMSSDREMGKQIDEPLKEQITRMIYKLKE